MIGKCIRTGSIIYDEVNNQYAHVDLFFDGTNLYSNKNQWINGKPEEYDASFTRADDEDEKYYILFDPKITKRLYDYVDGPYKGYIEQKFLDSFNYAE